MRIAAYFYFMEISPDLPPAIDHPATPLAPTLSRNLSFWLLAMLLGSMFLLLLPVIMDTYHDKDGYRFVVIALATILSLATLPLLLPLLPWALTAPPVGLRWLRVFTLQGLSLGGLTGLGYALAGGSAHGGFGIMALPVGTVYFVAGLLAAVVVYRAWLFRP